MKNWRNIIGQKRRAGEGFIIIVNRSGLIRGQQLINPNPIRILLFAECFSKGPGIGDCPSIRAFVS
tara:strand:- start:237 stop:434 length:198 start_codon:yes stop_codon:yes gene_type:complete